MNPCTYGSTIRNTGVILCFTVGMMLLQLCTAHAALQCYDCHGSRNTADNRPIDATYRNPSSGGFQGNHRTHMESGATPASCNACHGNGQDVGGYTASHRNRSIVMTANINNSPKAGGGVYSKGIFFNQTSLPANGSCSNVNCHFEATTPSWGIAPFASPNDCNKCHGSAPSDGSHPKHTTYYGSPETTASCVKCHPDHTAEAKPFAHATSAGKRGLAVSFNAAPNNGFGRYTGNVNYPNYLPSQGSARNGTCRNTYCHSPGTQPAASATVPNKSAQWGGELDCSGCHRATNTGTASSEIQTGSHRAHVTGYGTFYSQIQCVACHAVTATSAMTIADTANHVNGQITVAFSSTSSAANGSYNGSLAKPSSPSSKTPGSAYASCQNIYCHSSGQGDGGVWPPTYTTPTWGDAGSGKCGTCHGVDGSDTHGGVPGKMVQRRISTGSHKKHLVKFYDLFDSNMQCAICHAYDKAQFSTSFATCGPVCHGSSQQLKHANYEINVNIASYFGTTATYNGSTKPGAGYNSCSAVYCHSNGLASSPTYYTPVWGDPASGACGTCHGANAASPPASASHASHVGVNRLACVRCHSLTVTTTADATTFARITSHVLHVNKERNVTFDSLNPSGVYASGSKKCSSTYCHGTGTPTWGGAPLNCFSCHALATILASGSHAKHISAGATPTMYNYTANRSTASSYDFGCSNCHPMDSVSHVNGAINVTINKTNSGAGGAVGMLRSKNGATADGINIANSGIAGVSKSNVVCIAAYCHSNGNIGTLVFATTPNWYGGTFTGDRCANCHGNSPNSTIAGSKGHFNNRFLGYTSNPGGHQIGIHAMKIYSSPGGLAHAGTTGSSSHGNAATATTISCNVCHYATVTTARNDNNPVCASCHFSGNTVGAQSGNPAVIADRSKHVNGTADVAFQPVTIKSKAQMRQASFNMPLYSSVWKRNSGYKANGAHDAAKGALDTATMWDGSSKTCSSVACHNGNSVKWSDNDGITNCISCHSSL